MKKNPRITRHGAISVCTQEKKWFLLRAYVCSSYSLSLFLAAFLFEVVPSSIFYGKVAELRLQARVVMTYHYVFLPEMAT